MIFRRIVDWFCFNSQVANRIKFFTLWIKLFKAVLAQNPNKLAVNILDPNTPIFINLFPSFFICESHGEAVENRNNLHDEVFVRKFKELGAALFLALLVVYKISFCPLPAI